jgi:hypothetical protein
MRSRIVGSVLLAAAMVLPVGLGASPAGAAGGLTCTKLAGTVTWNPPVPAAPATAASTITLKASLKGCKGTPKVTSGVIKLPVIKKVPKRNCTTLATNAPKLSQKGGSIVWSNKKKSTLGVLTLKPAGLATYKATAKVTKGQFKNKKLTVIGTFVPTTACPYTKAKVAIKKGTKATVK